MNPNNAFHGQIILHWAVRRGGEAGDGAGGEVGRGGEVGGDSEHNHDGKHRKWVNKHLECWIIH